MNDLLQKHGCSNVFTVPEGLRELMGDISREVLRAQPDRIIEFIASYLSALLITREHGVLAVKILDDLCDCRPTVSEHLLEVGIPREEAEVLAEIIKEEVEAHDPEAGKEKLREAELLKKVLQNSALDEEMTARVCQVTRNAYRDYWYRKKTLQQNLKVDPGLPWEQAAQHTLEVYKKTKPSFSELERAAKRIQAAYRGYHIRRNLLQHLKPKKKKSGPKEKLPGPPLDIGGERDIDLGPVINIRTKVREEDVRYMFDQHAGDNLGLKYNPMKTITHVVDQPEKEDDALSIGSNVSRKKKEGHAFVVAQVSRAVDEGFVPTTATPTPVSESQKISFARKTDNVFIDDHDNRFFKTEKTYRVSIIPEDIMEYGTTQSDSAAPSIASSGPGTANVTDDEDDVDDDAE